MFLKSLSQIFSENSFTFLNNVCVVFRPQSINKEDSWTISLRSPFTLSSLPSILILFSFCVEIQFSLQFFLFFRPSTSFGALLNFQGFRIRSSSLESNCLSFIRRRSVDDLFMISLDFQARSCKMGKREGT